MQVYKKFLHLWLPLLKHTCPIPSAPMLPSHPFPFQPSLQHHPSVPHHSHGPCVFLQPHQQSLPSFAMAVVGNSAIYNDDSRLLYLALICSARIYYITIQDILYLEDYLCWYIRGPFRKLPCFHHIHFLSNLVCNTILLSHTIHIYLAFSCNPPSNLYLCLR